MATINPNDPNFSPGGKLDTPDARDFKWSGVGAALPPFDWNQGYDIEAILGRKLPVKDQNGSGSCGGQETSQYIGVQEAVATKSFEERSAKDVIADTYILGANGEMLGSTFRDNSNHAKNKGVAREIVCPSYDNGQPPTDAFMNRKQDITEAVIADEKLAKARSYAYVDQLNIDAFAQAVSANYGMGMLLRGSNNGTWFSPFPKPGPGAWGHFMYIGKLRLVNGVKQLGAIQSWGLNVGDAGWQWFTEDWFASGMILQGRTFVFDDAIPPPPKYLFTRNLTVGSTGIDVKYLQVFLNAHGCQVASTGPGSPGHESSYFGTLTQMAVAKFQRDNGITPALGYFGPLTRAKVNATQ